MSKPWVIRPRADQRMYVMKMMSELDSDNESAAIRSLIDLGIIRREEGVQLDTLLRIGTQQLALLKRIAHGIDPSLLQLAKEDAEALIQHIQKERSS